MLILFENISIIIIYFWNIHVLTNVTCVIICKNYGPGYFFSQIRGVLRVILKKTFGITAEEQRVHIQVGSGGDRLRHNTKCCSLLDCRSKHVQQNTNPPPAVGFSHTSVKWTPSVCWNIDMDQHFRVLHADPSYWAFSHICVNHEKSSLTSDTLLHPLHPPLSPWPQLSSRFFASVSLLSCSYLSLCAVTAKGLSQTWRTITKELWKLTLTTQ